VEEARFVGLITIRIKCTTPPFKIEMPKSSHLDWMGRDMVQVFLVSHLVWLVMGGRNRPDKTQIAKLLTKRNIQLLVSVFVVLLSVAIEPCQHGMLE
jgi:hypothetical protein